MYNSKLDLVETELAITVIKSYFCKELRENLNLKRVSAPLFLEANSGLNDNLNGVEKPVSFDVKGHHLEIVHSLAKWKRNALYVYGFEPGVGLYTDMNAVRKDEDLDDIHSLYVDQWDWEKVILKEDRNEKTLKNVVKAIYDCLKKTETEINKRYPNLNKKLADEICFITTQELENLYPSLTPKERENAIAKEKGSVFIMQIGDILNSGIKHDGRSSDYDDWKLNGDILVYNDVLGRAFELSSMGIRVDKEALLYQCNKNNNNDRLELPFHKGIISETLPFTIGGGIGQSRLCMFLLEKMHIGEVQSSFWTDDIIEDCKKKNINLL